MDEKVKRGCESWAWKCDYVWLGRESFGVCRTSRMVGLACLVSSLECSVCLCGMRTAQTAELLVIAVNRLMYNRPVYKSIDWASISDLAHASGLLALGLSGFVARSKVQC